ncbi:MAG: O-antigen ligase family protein [Planctomycetota bacterium]
MIRLILASLAIVLANFLWMRIRHPASIAMGASMIIAFTLPAYWRLEAFGIPFPIPTLSAIALLILYLVSGGSLRFRLTLPDLAVGLMMVVHCILDALFHQGDWTVPARAYGEWMLIYATGRYAFGSLEALHQARFQLATFALVSLGVWIIDVVTWVNLPMWLTEYVSSFEVPDKARRYGIVRSVGATTHPIFFAAIWMCMLPLLALGLSGRSEVPLRPLTERFAFPLRYLLGGVAACGGFVLLSRGAVLACLGGLLAYGCTRSRWFTLVLVLSVVGGATWGFQNREQVRDLWTRTGDFSDQRKTLVTVNGEVIEHSSTLARLRIFDVYGTAAKRAGLLGYGSEAVSGFPPNIPHLPKEALAIEKFWTVENSYLLMLLRFGWVGLAAFVFLMLSPFWAATTWMDWDIRAELQVLACGVLMMALLLATVYPDYQMIGPLLFLLGIMSGWTDPRVTQAAEKAIA